MLIYSPRSARLLVDRVTRAGLVSACARLVACCISAEAADALADIAFGDIRIAAHPDQDSLLELLGSTPPPTQSGEGDRPRVRPEAGPR